MRDTLAVDPEVCAAAQEHWSLTCDPAVFVTHVICIVGFAAST